MDAPLAGQVKLSMGKLMECRNPKPRYHFLNESDPIGTARTLGGFQLWGAGGSRANVASGSADVNFFRKALWPGTRAIVWPPFSVAEPLTGTSVNAQISL